MHGFITICLFFFQLQRFENGNDDLHIHLDQVNCTGMEDAIHLLACKHNRNGDHDCFHTEDVAIICSKEQNYELIIYILPI